MKKSAPISGTFATIESAVPGGFTGARLTGVTVHGMARRIEFVLEFPSGNGSPPRAALVSVDDVAWIEFEPRDPKAGGKHAGMRLVSDTLDDAAVARLGFPPVPSGAFAHRLHAQGTDGAMCFAAGRATLEWSSAPESGPA